MSFTNYPNGVTSLGLPLVGSGSDIPVTITGTYFFVNSSTGSSGNTGLSPEASVATITQALAKCTDSKGDVIIVAPGYTETIATAGGLTVSKIGVSIIGLGRGSMRPTLTLSATDSTIAVSAADVLIKNILCKGTVAELVTVFNVTAAGCTLDGVDFAGGATSTIKFLTTSVAADFLTIQNCHHFTTAAVTANAWWLQLTGCDDVVIRNNILHIVTSNHAASGCIGGLTTESLRVCITNNRLINLGTSCLGLSMLASSTGTVAYNTLGNSKTNGVGSMQPASCHFFENYETNETAKSGMLDPVTDTNA